MFLPPTIGISSPRPAEIPSNSKGRSLPGRNGARARGRGPGRRHGVVAAEEEEGPLTITKSASSTTRRDTRGITTTGAAMRHPARHLCRLTRTSAARTRTAGTTRTRSPWSRSTSRSGCHHQHPRGRMRAWIRVRGRDKDRDEGGWQDTLLLLLPLVPHSSSSSKGIWPGWAAAAAGG